MVPLSSYPSGYPPGITGASVRSIYRPDRSNYKRFFDGCSCSDCEYTRRSRAPWHPAALPPALAEPPPPSAGAHSGRFTPGSPRDAPSEPPSLPAASAAEAEDSATSTGCSDADDLPADHLPGASDDSDVEYEVDEFGELVKLGDCA